MDEESFREFLRKSKKSKSATESIVELVSEYEKYLSDEDLEVAAAQSEDLENFVSWIEEDLKEKANRRLWAITIFYEFKQDEKMVKFASSLRGKRIKPKPFPLAKFRGADQDIVNQLANIGIVNVDQMIQRCKTPASRRLLDPFE